MQADTAGSSDRGYFEQFAYLARYGKGLDAERIMLRWTAGDVNALVRALSDLVRGEKGTARG